MEKQSASNSKIKYTLLSILFSVLFIFTALKFSSPLTAYADDTTSGGVIGQYIIDNNLTGMYDLTYAQFQELLGVYNGD